MHRGSRSCARVDCNSIMRLPGTTNPILHILCSTKLHRVDQDCGGIIAPLGCVTSSIQWTQTVHNSRQHTSVPCGGRSMGSGAPAFPSSAFCSVASFPAPVCGAFSWTPFSASGFLSSPFSSSFCSNRPPELVIQHACNILH